MARLLFKSLVVVLLVFFVGNYLIYLKTGQMPLRDMRERLGSDWLTDLREQFSPDQLAAEAKQAVKNVSDKVSEPEPAAPTKVYKWTDANGQVHFGDKPTGGAEQIEVDTRNAISEPEESLDEVAAPQPDSQKTVHESALDKARAAAEVMKQRVQQQEEQVQ
ncbi:MAG TPA: DUF4124 domain-containing protein [Cellvibrio sp.]|nr:DUF4124 domain-containing protein [Cellvibrio sp.]